MLRFVLFAVLLAVSTATKVNECKSGIFPREVRVIGCEEMPCDVYKGENVEFEIDFTAQNACSKLTTKVRATTMGVTVPYPLPEKVSNVCTNLKDGQECPLDSDEDGTYRFLLPVEKYFPEIGVTVEISVEDQDKNNVVCFKADIKVKSK